MAKVVFLSLVFPPDNVSTAQIMGELALELKRLGHEVTVLTTSPHYNRDLEAEAKQPLNRYWGRILQKSNFRGITVYHVLMPKKSTNILARLPSLLSFHILSTVAGVFVLSNPAVFIVPSPPLTIGVSAWVLCLLHRSKYIYNVQEIYPDYAISLGAIRNKWLIRMLYKLEAFVYAKASAITVIAPHMAQQLISKGVASGKVRVIPNFADVDDLLPLPKDNPFSRQYDVHDKFLISYAGNMGPAQDLDTFIDCAALLQNHSEIHFMMIGDGMSRDKLRQRVRGLGLTNFTFLEYQPYSLVPQMYAASDLCLVPQSQSVTSVAIPSKVYRIMACARPVLASTVKDSDLATLVNTVKCGLVVEAGSAQLLAETILEASKNPASLVKMGEAGRVHVMEHYSRQAVARQYDDLIEAVTSKGKG